MMNILEQARYMDVPFIVTALSQTIIFYFGKIRRGKFLFTRPPCEVKQQAEAGSRTFFSRYFVKEYSECHYAVVKRAPRLNADSSFFVSEARVSWETLEDRIFRNLKSFQILNKSNPVIVL